VDITVTETPLEGVVIVDTDFFTDARGFFIEAYHKARYAASGIDYDFVQDNHSRSAKGVLRGFHYQSQEAPMGKLVRCTRGTIFDVALDLRIASPTCGQWFGIELSEENMRQLMVPSGFGHAFLTLSDSAEVQYKCTGFYDPPSESTIAWNDAEIDVSWPLEAPTLSARDQQGMSYRDYLRNPAF